MAPAAEDNTALHAQSIVERLFPQPSLVYDAGNVAPPACYLVLAAARVLSVALHEAAQNDSKRATTPDEPGVMSDGQVHPFDKSSVEPCME